MLSQGELEGKTGPASGRVRQVVRVSTLKASVTINLQTPILHQASGYLHHRTLYKGQGSWGISLSQTVQGLGISLALEIEPVIVVAGHEFQNFSIGKTYAQSANYREVRWTVGKKATEY